MMQKDRREAAVEQDIARLMEQAAARPGPDDPMGMVGFGSTWLAATLWIKQEEGKVKEKEERK